MEVFHTLKGVLKKRGYNTAVGDEGGFAPQLKSNEEAIEVVLEAIQQAGYKPGKEICHRARSRRQRVLTQDGKYVFKKSDKSAKSSDEMVRLLGEVGATNIRSSRIEDGLAENDWDGWKNAHRSSSARRFNWSATICSSPTSNSCSKGIDEGIANSILIKVNQIGTLTETLDAIDLARRNGYTSVISPPLRRNRRHHHRRHRRRHQRRPDQDRLRLPHRPHRQVQPVAADRRRAGRLGEVPGSEGAEL